ncbi:superoxide dismutase [Falsiroseomonas selenitidurans]|uniref:Superoxide dismutase n=1 Tax=Falsiroseomonas selenitidurans TaxID=2716335 RepID=A0ABX1E7R6_9PROT|nr:superoxide dismutase [Falsiroseomonas selenitidurans]NKC32961.1 superoxide dismutase [Falsiroseomonas selenitidurans]
MRLLPRRGLLAAAALAAALPAPRAARAQAAPASAGPHVQAPLPYAYGANEAAIDARTMELHYRFHHGGQVANLNAALRNHGQLAEQPLDRLLMNLSQVPEAVRSAVRNNGGGHANHTMFWAIMGGQGGEPSGPLAAAIARDFGDFASFRSRFNAAANGVFGSGWAFVTVTTAGRLAIATRPNQDTPLFDGQRVLMGNDVWEHAYYLRYQNRRADYTAGWWNVLDWQRIAARHAAAQDGTLGV